MNTTLLLSTTYEAYDSVPWEKAFYYLCGGKDGTEKVEVLKYHEDKKIHSGSSTVSGELREWRIPSVIRFIDAVTPVIKTVKFSRENIYARDKGKCQYCGQKVKLDEFEYEHVTPRRKPYCGPTTWENIVTACTSCNQKKGGRTPKEAGMVLLSTPRRPDKLSSTRRLSLEWHVGMPESWRPYMRDSIYWKTELDNDNK